MTWIVLKAPLNSNQLTLLELYTCRLQLFVGKYLTDVEPMESSEVSSVWKIFSSVKTWRLWDIFM